MKVLLSFAGAVVLALSAAPLSATATQPVVTSPSPSARADGDVTGDDLPSKAQVVKIYPHVRHEPRQRFRGKDIYLKGEFCPEGDKVLHGVQGAGSYFYNPFDGPKKPGDEPRTRVVRFEDEASATRALRRIRDYANDCSGTHREGRRSETLTKISVPRHGDAGRVAFTFDEKRKGRSRGVLLQIYYKVGAVLVNSIAINEQGDVPSRQRAERLATLQEKTLR